MGCLDVGYSLVWKKKYVTTVYSTRLLIKVTVIQRDQPWKGGGYVSHLYENCSLSHPVTFKIQSICMLVSKKLSWSVN